MTLPLLGTLNIVDAPGRFVYEHLLMTAHFTPFTRPLRPSSPKIAEHPHPRTVQSPSPSLSPRIRGLMYKDLHRFPTQTWCTLKPKCPPMHKNIRMYESVCTHESKHVSFVHPNQHQIERTCRSIRLLPVHAPTSICKSYLNEPCTCDSPLCTIRKQRGQEKKGPHCLNRESAQLWVTLLSQG